MSFSADNVPADLRKAILAQVRQQVGPGTYSQLVDRVGEDGILNMVLTQSSKSGPVQQKSGASSWGKYILQGLGWITLIVLLLIPGVSEIVTIIFVVVGLGDIAKENPEVAGIGCVIALALGAVAGVVAGVWWLF
jgi:hypothetical protein